MELRVAQGCNRCVEWRFVIDCLSSVLKAIIVQGDCQRYDTVDDMISTTLCASMIETEFATMSLLLVSDTGISSCYCT